jgi:hypothetical protein
MACLLDDYDKAVRPVADPKDTVVVTFNLVLTNLRTMVGGVTVKLCIANAHVFADGRTARFSNERLASSCKLCLSIIMTAIYGNEAFL